MLSCRNIRNLKKHQKNILIQHSGTQESLIVVVLHIWAFIIFYSPFVQRGWAENHDPGIATGRGAPHMLGQVVVDLATAEGACGKRLDAGATTVRWSSRITEQTALRFDNGTGIDTSNHCARSKASHIKTQHFCGPWGSPIFGFRGEAISSLCELSESFEVLTNWDQEIGARLSLDRRGVLCLSQQHVQTALLSVGEFSRRCQWGARSCWTLKRQYTRMLGHLQAYAVLQTDVCMSCTITSKPKAAAKENVSECWQLRVELLCSPTFQVYLASNFRLLL